jgi:2-polyprenyl-6-methoxyphenol hydroxylase-like FAD-dependent oxidoreductase
VVLLGDAVHATTPHLGQGAGMAVEDAIVLAEELARADAPEPAFAAYRNRRHERCKAIVEMSLAVCRSQLGTGPKFDYGEASRRMFQTVSQPI